MAEKIDVDLGSLKDLYEQGKIDGVNLRKVVAEQVAGRDYEALLKRSLEAEEMKHELRNEVKTTATQDPQSTGADGGFSASGGAAAVSTAPVAKKQTKESESMLSARAGNSSDMYSAANTTQALPNMQQTGLLPDPSQTVYTSRSQPQQDSEVRTEYLRVPTSVAIALGVMTGSVSAGLLMLLVF